LSATDEAIHKTEEVITKTEELKKGLMQELFTKGIGHTKFKKTSIGKIPEEWGFGGFVDMVDPKDKNSIKPGPFGSSIKKDMYVKSGYKVYGQEQVISGDIHLGDYYITEEKFQELSMFSVKKDDILISLVGTIGRVLVVPENHEKGIINPRLLKISLDQSVADSKFVAYLLTSPLLVSLISAKGHGGTMDILNKTNLVSLQFGIPPKKEQREIAEVLSGVDQKISANKKLLAKQLELKRGLMQDLLSGDVRVKI
jgi:type I restriction enzyme S subunit